MAGIRDLPYDENPGDGDVESQGWNLAL
jgi:hypothetical protein